MSSQTEPFNIISCTCMTKPPELKYHSEDCKYRKWLEPYSSNWAEAMVIALKEEDK